jgi:Flp pilus assembly protein TadG
MLRALSRSVGAASNKPKRLTADRRGVTAIEFAIAAPAMLMIGVGMMKFGLAISQYLMLTNAAAQGVTAFALSRGTTNPYTLATTAITNAAPSLIAGSITKTLKINGTACTSDTDCKSSLTTNGAGATALVITSYPCDLTVMGVNFKSSCTLTAQSAQMIQ